MTQAQLSNALEDLAKNFYSYMVTLKDTIYEIDAKMIKFEKSIEEVNSNLQLKE
jgi:hypothetical protein